MEETLIIIDDKIVSSEVLTEYFACDYEVCGGACCVIGDSGAPMTEEEAQLVEDNYERFSPLMDAAGKEVVRRKGFFEIDMDGDIVTPLVGSSEQCAFCRCDREGHHYCTIERSFCEGGSSFRKPISCRLYPIRVSRLSSGMTALNLHRWDICRDAFLKGRRERIRVFRFLKDPICEAFGRDFYDALEAACRQMTR